MIKSLDLKNFTAFTGLHIDFSPKINVIIGENSTGKTHLLKAIYSLYAGTSLSRAKVVASDDELGNVLTYHLLRIFKPMDVKLGKLRQHGSSKSATLKAAFNYDGILELNFNTNSKLLIVKNQYNYEFCENAAIFIPTKETLSFMQGFTSLYDKYELSFDETYQDICMSLDHPALRAEKISEKSKWAIKEIEEICGGKFIFHGGGKVTFKTDDNEYSANAVAEGFRKLGMLYRLLETGTISPGNDAPLLWDEPEANLNPKLMERLVQILLELSRNGQQIILATHDYVLLKWFDLLADTGKGDYVLYHSLYKDNGEIKLKSTDDYREIYPNAIADTFIDLTKEQVNKKMGRLGK
jgi:AAA15 family ATPase/GTPase